MKTRKIVDRTLEVLLVLVMGILVIDVVWNVVARYLLDAPSSFSVELATFLLIWVGMLGTAYTSGRKEHVAIELFPQWVESKSARKKRQLDHVINILIILFALFVLVIGGARLVFIVTKMSQVSATMQIPMGIVYFCLPLSGLLIIFYAVHEMIFGLPEEVKKTNERT